MKFGPTLTDEDLSLPSFEVYKDVAMDSQPVMKDDKAVSYKISKNVNVKAVMGAIHNIFTWIPGERILLPEFGSRLQMLLYEGITPLTEERITAEIRGIVTEWEPRAQIAEIRNVSTVEDTEDNTIHLEIVFTIPSLSDDQYTYSFKYNMLDK